MDSQNSSKKPPVGVIGAGSFGTAIANLLAENGEVILFSRRKEVVDRILKEKRNVGQIMHPHVHPTDNIEELCNKCFLIFPSIPSDVFRQVMKTASPFLRPDHILIHCTKGFDIKLEEGVSLIDKKLKLKPTDISTMSQVILEETIVKRVGCLSGPNLSKEIADGQPAATVIGSHFDEVIREGQQAIRSKRFQAYGSHDMVSVELGGVLKNSMAVAAGMVGGMGYGQNSMSFLISRGLSEIVRLGKALGAQPEAFLGLAGIGDLIATCTSPLSRNYTVGYRLAKGENLQQIIDSSTEIAEGIRTVNICKKLSETLDIRLPIIEITYEILYNEMPIADGLKFLMEYRKGHDIDFMG
jgi:glycerol-3-phosphate dehydrogenase (NAD(P)+)